jgi:hypothetical protein
MQRNSDMNVLSGDPHGGGGTGDGGRRRAVPGLSIAHELGVTLRDVRARLDAEASERSPRLPVCPVALLAALEHMRVENARLRRELQAVTRAAVYFAGDGAPSLSRFSDHGCQSATTP